MRFQATAPSCADVMVSKMDSCMVDLVDFHQKVADEQKAEALRQQSAPEAQEAEEPQKTEVEEPQTTEGADTVIATAKSSESVYYDSTDCELNDPQQENMERQVSQGFNFQQRRKQQDTGILAALRRSFGYASPFFPYTTHKSYQQLVHLLSIFYRQYNDGTSHMNSI